jgi:enamine deaminase RidA (YjgF/YER057c/UK114 family)
VSIQRIDPGQRLSEAVTYGDLVFLAGHVGGDPSAGVTEQTRDILRQIDGHLAAAGTDRSKLLSVQIWLADIATFAEMNAAWDEWVDKENLPARATVEARLASPDYKVEIAGIAAR